MTRLATEELVCLVILRMSVVVPPDGISSSNTSVVRIPDFMGLRQG